MKRLWIVAGFLVVALALGAWLTFSVKPAGRVSIRFLGFETDAANERSAVLWITNGHDFPVSCEYSANTMSNGIGVTVITEPVIDPHSALSQRFGAEQLARTSDGRFQLEVRAYWEKPFTRTERLRLGLRNCLQSWDWEFLSRFVAPEVSETALSEPIAFPPDEKAK